MTAGCLEGQGLTKTFAGLTAVDDVSFRLSAGEVLGLIGPNGAGKTTLFNMLTGFARPTSGRVLWEDAVITGLRPHAIARRGLARTFQHAELFADMSLRDNVMVGSHLSLVPDARSKVSAMLGAPRHRARARRAAETAEMLLEQIGLQGRGDALAGALPHGDARRLTIAVALAARPRALLLDEPASGLNHTETADLMSRLRSVAGTGTALLIVEHDMTLVMGLCGRVIVLNFGQKIFDGPPEAAQESAEVIEAYLGVADAH